MNRNDRARCSVALLTNTAASFYERSQTTIVPDSKTKQVLMQLNPIDRKPKQE
jgi:hypothetical protein